VPNVALQIHLLRLREGVFDKVLVKIVIEIFTDKIAGMVGKEDSAFEEADGEEIQPAPDDADHPPCEEPATDDI
jgi:hypothetical protein